MGKLVEVQHRNQWIPLSPERVFQDLNRPPKEREDAFHGFKAGLDAVREYIAEDPVHGRAMELVAERRMKWDLVLLSSLRSSPLYGNGFREAALEAYNTANLRIEGTTERVPRNVIVDLKKVGGELNTGEKTAQFENEKVTPLRAAYEKLKHDVDVLMGEVPDELLEKYVGKFEHQEYRVEGDPTKGITTEITHDEIIRRQVAAQTLVLQLLTTPQGEYTKLRSPGDPKGLMTGITS